MANRTIGGSQNLDSMDIDHYKSQQEQQSLAIWDYDSDINHTRRISPKNLIDNSDTIIELGTDIDDIKKDLGGNGEDPYTYERISEWTDSKYKEEQDYPEETSAFTEIKYIESDLTNNINKQIESIKRDLGYKPAATEGASTYYSINEKNESPDSYDSAYLWLNSLQSKIPRLGTWPSQPIVTAIKGNAYSWLNSLDSDVNTLKNKIPRLGTWPSTPAATVTPKGNAYSWLSSLQTQVDGIEKIHTIPRTKWVDLNKEATYTKYTFRLQPDGNIVFYRTTEEGAVQSDRNWVWQSGPQYSPAIFKVTAEYTCNASAGTFTGANSDTLTITSTSNPNIEIGGIQYNYSNASTIVPYLSTGRAVSILAVKNVNTTDYSINDITITPSRHAIKLIGVQKKNTGNKPIQLRLICCDDNNIPDPSHYQNDPYDNNGNRT